MADNTTLNIGSGGDVMRCLEDGSSIKWPACVVCYATTVGTPDVLSVVTPSNGLPTNIKQINSDPVDIGIGSASDGTLRVVLASNQPVVAVNDNGGSLTVDGTVAVSGTVAVTDNSGSLTVDDGGLTLSIDDGGSTVSIDDGGSSITVDGSVSITGTATISGIVTLGAALPTGSNNIGGVDVLTMPGTAAEAAALPAAFVVVAGDDGTDTHPLQTDPNGYLKVVIPTGNIPDFNLSTIDENGVDVNTGNASVGTLRVVLASNQPIVSVNDTAATSGGATPYKLISAASTNSTSIKGSAGQVYGIFATNINASPRYLKLYNKATAPTVGTDTPVATYLIPGNTAGGGLRISFPRGLVLGTGIGIALTTGVADADTGAVAANEIVVNLEYA